MASSQFKIITSADRGAPVLNGVTGSLIPVLDFCLITGSGWLQPSASVKFNSAVDTLAVYQQPSGSKCILYVNDAGPHATTLGKEAQVKGWENLATMSAPLGTGSGEFPYYGQIQTNGHICVVKSALANATINRQWFMFVDAYTFYLFIDSGDAIGKYQSLFFGDIYSLQGPGDYKKCQIQGKLTDNQPTVAGGDYNDSITVMLTGIFGINQGASGFINRSSDGRYLSNWITKMGDFAKAITTTPAAINSFTPMAGGVPGPNTTDKSLYLSPIFINESFGQNSCVRGRMRGMYHLCHPIANFSDGQTFGGIGEQFGKTFQVIKQGWNGGMWCIETSNTVETN